MIIIGTYLFLQSLKCRVERLYNIGSTTSSYDRRTAFFIQLVLRSFNDWFYLFYLPVVKWSFVSNRFSVLWLLNDFSQRSVFLSSNDHFWRTLFINFEQSFQRSFFTIFDGPLRRTHFREYFSFAIVQYFNDFFVAAMNDRFYIPPLMILKRFLLTHFERSFPTIPFCDRPTIELRKTNGAIVQQSFLETPY